MKRILLPVVFSMFVSVGFSQSLKKATKYFDSKDFANAKTEVEAYLEKNPKDGEAIYLKSKIYEGIADSAALHSLVNGDARAEAFQAFQQALADSSNMKVKLAVMKDNYKPVFDMYTGYYQAAVDDFNKAASTGDKSFFKNAMDNFINADNVGQYISKNEWAKIGKVDTTLVLNIGKAAINAKDDATAIEYFKKLADNKIAGPVGANDEGFKLPYEWLEQHYKESKDEANMLKYAKLGAEVYPKEPFFYLVLMDYYRENNDKMKLFGVYQNLVDAHPDSLKYRFSYANEIFGYIYNTSDEAAVVSDRAKWKATMVDQLDKSLAIDPNDVNSNWLYSQVFYNQGIDTRDSALKVKDATAKLNLNNEAKDDWNKAIPYATKALDMLDAKGKKSDKSRYKSIVNLMQNIYQSLGDNVNLKKYQDMYDAADKKFDSRA